jgi:hypothetical protein
MQGAADRADREYRQAVGIAHLQAHLSRAKKIPPLRNLLRRKEKSTPAEIRANLRAMSQSLPKRKWSEWLNQS